VRVEFVISGAASIKAFYCGMCEHQWSVADTPPIRKASIPRSKPRTRSYGPKRRG